MTVVDHVIIKSCRSSLHRGVVQLRRLISSCKFASLAFILLLATSVFGDDVVNPELLPTSDQASEPIPHFPTRTAAFIWRNWNVAPLESLARTLDVSPDTVAEFADRLGLPRYCAPTWEPERAYITILRRNWSLLPYEQLLVLLDLSESELAKKLREDDFLSVKLGAKPRCEPLVYEPPTPETSRAFDEIATIARAYFDSDAYRAREPLFDFLRRFESEPSAKDQSFDVQQVADSPLQLCYLHSYFAVFGDPLLQDSRALYPDQLLRDLSSRGVNGVWLHTLLRDVAPRSDLFPEFGADSERRRATLRDLVARAQRYGISVYLYMNEPRALPTTFFASHPGERGVTEGAYSAMCASSPKVRQWLVDSLSGLFSEVPGLGGIFTITGSENLTSCVSHRHFSDCPRCSQFTDADLLVDLNAAMEEGVHRSAPNAKVIVWDWGWRGHGIATDVIERLPKNVWLQSVSEWSLPLTRGGVKVAVGEYSISAVGPGARALAHWRAAQDAGLKTVAKCQFNTTWELGSSPSVPAFDLIARHVDNLRASGVDGVMAGWSLGGYPSMNLELATSLFSRRSASVDEILDEFSTRYFGDGASLARTGWRLVSEGFQEFPYAGAVVYNAPVQIGAANLLRMTPTGWRSTMVGIPYDDLERWRGPYPSAVFESQLSRSAALILSGADALDLAAARSPDARREEASSQARQARYMGSVYQSVANQTRFILLRDELLALRNVETALDESQRERIAQLDSELKQVVESELATTETTLTLCLEDSRFGFESTNQYWFVPNDLIEKIISCRAILRELSKGE